VPVKKYKPTSPALRFLTTVTFEDLTKERPEKALLLRKKTSAGRDSQGRVAMRHRGGGHRKLVRIVDFKRDKDHVPAKVAAIEYDPNRSANIALLHYADGEKRYILAPVGLQVGARVMSGTEAEIRVGNSLPLSNVPLGSEVHNIELEVGKGGQLCRSAGTAAQLMAKEGKFAHLRLPSSEVRMVYLACRATIGRVGNLDHSNITLGKAGRVRLMGRRPRVRGVAMTPRDHPHGGGEGRSGVGRKRPMTRWGKPATGTKTRRPTKPSGRLIVKRRSK